MKQKKYIQIKIFAVTLFIIFGNKIHSQTQVLPANFYTNGCIWFTHTNNTIQVHDRDYQLVFQDDFNGTVLNSTDWSTHYPWGRSLTNTLNGSGTGYEWQYYADYNVSVSAGYLHLKTQLDPGYRDVEDGTSPNIQYFQYTSGMVYGTAPYKAGKFEIRCQLPYIDGAWPAFWLYGDCEQEIDGFELTNASYNSNASTDSHNIIMTWHDNGTCTDHSTNCSSGVTHTTGADLVNAFHTYSVDWDETKIIWMMDGNIYRQVYRYWGWDFSTQWPLTTPSEIKSESLPIEFKAFPTEDKEMHIIINTAVPFARSNTTKEFLIDYIKVYAKSDCYTNSTLCANNIASPGIIASKTITTNSSCNFTIAGSSQAIEMKAIDAITLNPGFSSDLNSNFYAHITDCENYLVRSPDQNLIAPIKNNPSTSSSVTSANEVDKDLQTTTGDNLNLNIFPNPTTGEFYVSTTINEHIISNLEVVNVLGEKILFDQTDNGELVKINLKTATKGIYIVKIFCDGKTYFKKIIYN